MAIVSGRKVRKRERPQLKAVSKKDWLTLKQHLSKRTDIRGLMLHLIQCTGARLEEVCRVDIEDVKTALKTGALYIDPAKNSEPRYCRTVPEELLLKLASLDSEVPKNQPIAWLISPGDHKSIKRTWMKAIQRELERLCKELGMEHYGPHALRHAYCMMLIADTNNIATVQKIIGHKSIANTARYLVSAETDDIEEKLARRFA